MWLIVWIIPLVVGGIQAQEDELYPDEATRRIREVGMETTGQIVMETKVEQKSFNDTHTFIVSKTLEYFVKFEVPEETIKMLMLEPDRKIFQVNAFSRDAVEQYPVDMTIRQLKQMKTFQIPSVERKENRIIYASQKRSVDFCPMINIDSNSTVFVSISTRSRTPVTVEIRVLVKGKNADWKVVATPDGGKEFRSKTTIKPVISRIRYFDTNLIDSNTIIIKVTTRNDTDCLCSIISIQQPTCPFYDEVGTTMRHGLFSTMLDTGTVILHPKDYPQGFLLVLVASATDDVCKTNRCTEKNHNVTDPRKKVSIQIASNGTPSDYVMATMAILGMYLGIFALTISFSVLEFRYEFSDFEEVRANIVGKIEEKMAVMMEGATQLTEGWGGSTKRKPSKGYAVADGLKKIDSPTLGVAAGEVTRSNEALFVAEDEKAMKNTDKKSGDKENNKIVPIILRDPPNTNFETPRESFEFIDKSEDEEEYKSVAEKAKSENSFIASMEDLRDVPDIDTADSKMRTRMKKDLKVADLSKKILDPRKTKSVYQKSQLYLGVLFVVSIYYSLPVLQMVFRFSAEQSFTGNQDICYYNDLCRKPLGHVRDFNHVFSNLGYIVFGFLFMCIVLFKKVKYESFLKKNKGIQQEEYGVPSQYGLYFAMGLSLVMEGVMSSSYHVCPTTVTFQFDTTFMYLIAVLMFIKLYQVRHADVSANAVGVFFGLGVALMLETISIYYSGPWFWAFFCTVYIIVIVVVAVFTYNIGAIQYDWKILCVVSRIIAAEFKRMCCKDKDDTGHRARPRLICLVIMGLINVALCLYFGISGTPGASNYLLAIFFLNLTIYGVYYCVMKVMNGEKIKAIPMIYANLGLICFLPSLYYFTQKEKNTEISPSESRDMNVDCQFLGFFDGHDIWHFLGGAGVFFAFLCIFTLDEDVKFVRRDAIRVF